MTVQTKQLLFLYYHVYIKDKGAAIQKDTTQNSQQAQQKYCNFKQTNKQNQLITVWMDLNIILIFFSVSLLFMNMPIHIYIPLYFLSLYTISSVIHCLDSFPKERRR